MTLIEKLIKRLFSHKVVTSRLSDLINQLLNQNLNNHICISIAKDNDSRLFTYVNIDELIILYQHSSVVQRSLYELITPGTQVKTYIDFEYYINNNLDIQDSRIGASCFLKILYYFLNFQDNNIYEKNNYINLILQQFLVLEASTSKKISYHFIHANPHILFENNFTLGLFIKVVIHFSLWLIARHKCTSFEINLTLKKYTICELIMLLKPYVHTLRTYCTECQAYSGYITVAEIAHLLVFNKENELSLAVDLSVYSKNQQFRLFDCVKSGNTNPLIQSTYFSYNNNSQIPYFEVLRNSLITNIEKGEIPIIYLKNNQFLQTFIDNINSSSNLIFNLDNFNNLNVHISTFFMFGSNYPPISNLNELNNSQKAITCTNVDSCEEQMQQFTLFVKKLIESDREHQGHIRSCVRGHRNRDILFFNIEGEFRFCPRKGSHHEHNRVAILVDTKNLTYTIRCKDPNCNNERLMWKKMDLM